MLGLILLTILLIPTELIADSADTLRISMGGSDGIYRDIAKRAADSIRTETDLEPTVMASTGSKQNIRRLHEDRADVAVVQQDVASRFFQRRPETPLKVVSRPFVEHLHILVRRRLNVQDLPSLGGMALWLGNPGSGSRFTALDLLDRVGLSTTQFQVQEELKTPRTLDDQFEQRHLDAALIVSLAGNPWVREDIDDNAYRLLPLQYEALRSVIQEPSDIRRQRQTFISEIPANTYPDQDDSVPTVAIPTLLMARNDFSPSMMKTLETSFEQAWRHIRRDQQLAPSPAPTSKLSEAGFPLVEWHRDAAQSFNWWFWVSGAALLLIVAGIAGAVWYYRRTLTHRFGRKGALIPLAIVVSIALLATVGAYLAERNVNENFATIPDAFWSITVFLFSGLEVSPHTILGKIFATIAIITGPVIVAVLTGWIASSLVLNYMEDKVPAGLSDHYVIINWCDRTRMVIDELRDSVLERNNELRPIVVITPPDGVESVREFKQQEGVQAHDGESERGLTDLEQVYFSLGDPARESILRNARVQDAKAILILSPGDRDDIDDEVLMRSVFAIREIAEDEGIEELNVVFELDDLSNRIILEGIADNFPGTLEIVSQAEIGTLLLSQVVHIPGLSEMYRNLLEFSGSNNEIYTIDIPESAVGTSFRDYTARVVTDASDLILPIGVQRNVDGDPKLVCNPRPDNPEEQAFCTLCSGDRLVAIAFEQPTSEVLPEGA